MIALLVLILQAPDPLDRLIDELKGPSAERQAIAKLALRAYGGLAVDRLKKAELDAKFVGEAGPTAEDREILAKLKSIRVTIDMQNAPLSAIVDYLQEITGLKVQIDPKAVPDADKEMISFRVQDIVLDGALRLMLGPKGHRYVVRRGVVVVTGEGGGDPPPPRLPVRILADVPEARTWIGGLSAETPEERERAIDGLRRLGFAAERALWEALDSKDPETLSRAGEVLRELYTPEPRIDAPAAAKALQGKTLLCSFKNASPAEVLGFLSDGAGVSIVHDARWPFPERTVTTWETDRADTLLAEFVNQFGREYVVVDDWVLVTRDGERVLGSRPYGPVWTDPATARKIEDLIGRLACDDASRHGPAVERLLAMDPLILGPLLQASRILPPDAAARCRAARERYVDEKGLWLCDEPSGAELQALDDAGKALLEKRLDLRVPGRSLEDALKDAGIPAQVKAGHTLKLHLWARGMRTSTFLKAATRPYGLDFHVDGGTVVVDTAAKVRRAVGR